MYERLLDSHVSNHGNSCTSASLLIALGGLGAKELPELGPATLQFGGQGMYESPKISDYIGIPFLRRAPIDVRVESVAAASGLRVRSKTRLSLVPWRLRAPKAGEAVVGHMLKGWEGPGKYGAWNISNSFKFLDRRTWGANGHSVVVAGSEGKKGYAVVDSNHRELQHWPTRGIAVTSTRIRVLQ